MTLADLTADERTALLALIVQMIGADQGRSTEEMEEFRAIAEEMGRREFDEAFRGATKVGNREAAIALAKTALARPEARNLAHTVLVDLASADSISEDERKLIREVASALDVQTRL
jgi:uncharacterized tellurite resistance protein B-like protein